MSGVIMHYKYKYLTNRLSDNLVTRTGWLLV